MLYFPSKYRTSVTKTACLEGGKMDTGGKENHIFSPAEYFK
jgi:hypothetical protein